MELIHYSTECDFEKQIIHSVHNLSTILFCFHQKQDGVVNKTFV
ncbi:hypothetical protein [Clostridium grantii]|nr:hypothetical protein [Clostridium grantii]